MLAIIIPTRRRWHWLVRQAEILGRQLRADERVVIVFDDDPPIDNVIEDLENHIGDKLLSFVCLSYPRPPDPFVCVNRARNAGAALAPAGYDIVEVDDHDLLDPFALSEIRQAFEAGFDYVFADFHQRAWIELPSGRATLEAWPDVKHDYRPNGFTRREIEAIGVRAIRRELWDRLGGWSNTVWPGGDYDFAQRAEAAGARIACLERPLCTVLIDPTSLSAKYRGKRMMSHGGLTADRSNRRAP